MRPTPLVLALLLPIVAVPLLAQVLAGPIETTPRQAVATGAEVAEGGVWHEVRPGENLRSIARTYYGSARYWRTVQLANDVGLSPAVGRRIWVPGNLPELP